MKHLVLFLKLFIVIVFIGQLNAQQLINVEASGMTFTPADITIDIGDTVRWTNTSGFHNVNGTTTTFPSNPGSFGNSTGTGWVYEHVFTVAGTYDYQCDVHFSSGMVGTVTVLDPSGLSEVENKSFRIYPNPAKDHINIDLMEKATIVVYNLIGEEMDRMVSPGKNKVRVDLSGYPGGAYFVKMTLENGLSQSQKILKN